MGFVRLGHFLAGHFLHFVWILRSSCERFLDHFPEIFLNIQKGVLLQYGGKGVFVCLFFLIFIFLRCIFSEGFVLT